jgi:hypothetical protein
MGEFGNTMFFICVFFSLFIRYTYTTRTFIMQIQSLITNNKNVKGIYQKLCIILINVKPGLVRFELSYFIDWVIFAIYGH